MRHPQRASRAWTRWIGLSMLLFTPILSLSLDACSECSTGTSIQGVCVGVTSLTLCDGDHCTDNASCSATAEVSSDSELESALDAARAGTCIALGPGSYGDVALPGGVSLLGKGAADVTVTGVTIAQGTGALVRGLTITTHGLQIGDGATSVRVEDVRMEGSQGDALHVGVGASVEVSRSEIRGAKEAGLWASDAAIALRQSLIESTQGEGFWAQCSGGCACPDEARPAITLESVVVRKATGDGVALLGVDAVLRGVRVEDMLQASGFDAPRTLSAAACTNIDGSGIHVVDNNADDAQIGVLVDESTGTLGGDDDEHGVRVEGCRFGLTVQHIAEETPVLLRHARLERSRGAALMVGEDSMGFIVNWLTADNTSLESLADLDGNTVNVGDGVVWRGGSRAELHNVTLGGSARQSVLIDGPVADASVLENITLQNGDEDTGILQQQCSGCTSPDTSNAGLTISQDAALVLPVAASPGAP